jgi:uncharacterized protein (DUF2384 family)
MAATVTLTTDASTKTLVSPLVPLGSIIMVFGVLLSTWKAWQWKAVGIGTKNTLTRMEMHEAHTNQLKVEVPERILRQAHVLNSVPLLLQDQPSSLQTILAI